MRRILFFLAVCCALTLLGSTPAGAQERAVYVVVVSPSATEIDAPQLRARIGAELQADAVAPDDPRADTARGRIDVSVERGAGQLVVSYDGGAEPLVRRVPLPADAHETSLAAVLLASNLARDEAGELAAQLRRSNPAPPQPSADELKEARDNEILRRMLSAYADHDRSVRRTVAWTEIGLGVGATAGAIASFVFDRDSNGWGAPLASVGIPLMIFGSVGLATPSTFEELRDYFDSTRSGGGSPSWLRPTVEQRWKKEAIKARQARSGFLVAMLALGALDAGAGTLLLATGPRSSPGTVAGDISLIGLGVGAGVWGVVAAETESTTEQRLRSYEHAVGHPVELTDVGLRVAPTPGGLTVGLGGRF